MNNITLIAAVGKNGELGKSNGLIWSIPEDLSFFKENTINKHIIMGINTLNSLPKLLPNRKHIVLTHREVELDSSILVFHSLDDLLKYIDLVDEEVMVIGGAQIYSQMMEYANKMLLTEIDDICSDADVYFPEITFDDWDKVVLSNNEYNGIKYRHTSYTRRRCK